MVISNASTNLSALNGTSADWASSLRVLAYKAGTGQPALAVVEKHGELYGGAAAAGRRVALPWGGNAFEISDLNAAGEEILERALRWAAVDPDAGWLSTDIGGFSPPGSDSRSGGVFTLTGGRGRHRQRT